MARAASQPFHLMLKPVGASCNLACKYCYYREKAALFPGSALRMDDETLERVSAAYLQANPAPEVVFGWQGGEPLLAGLGFYGRALELQREHARPGVRVMNALQTNATLIDDEWAAFFADHGFLVGVSIDGPPELHDRYRVDHTRRPSYEQAATGLRTLQRHGVECNALVTVNRWNSEHPLRVYRHLVDLGFQHLQFIPVVERESPNARKVTPWSVRPKVLGQFLCEVFDYWARRDVGRVFVQLFESALNVWLGRPPTMCVFAPTCGRALVVEHNGDLYACDHFVYPEYHRGAVTPGGLAALVDGGEQSAFGRAKSDLAERCRACPVRKFCGGDCSKHRLQADEDGHPISYLCAAYRRFFAHSAQALEAMAHEIRAGRPEAGVMEALEASGP